MINQKNGKPKPGFGFVIGILTLIMLLGLAGELHPARAMELQGGVAPDANDDTFGFRIGVGTTVAAPGVLANDTDVDDEVISAIPVSDGTTADSGTYTLFANGEFTYTPPATPPDTTDTFTYRVVDTTDPQYTSGFATVTLVGSNYYIMDDRYGFRTGTFRYIYTAIGLLSNDDPTLPEGAYVELVPGSGPEFGSLSPLTDPPQPYPAGLTHGLQLDGSFTYYADTSGNLTDQFQYIVKDSGGVQIGGPATVLLTNSFTCTVDVNGPNDETGQGDLTQFCRDTYFEEPETELSLSVNWDEVSLGGTNSADACALFDTNGDRGVNYALCMSWQQNGVPTNGYPKFYSCGNDLGFPQNCTNPIVEIDLSAVPRFSCELLRTNDDPFDPDGDQFPYDSKAICYIPYDLAFPEAVQDNIRLTDVCAYPSREPNSAFKDCIRFSLLATPTLKVVKDVVGLDTYRSAEWLIGIDPLPVRPLNTTVTPNLPADNSLIDDDETPTYTIAPGSYTITETEGDLNPYPFMTISGQRYQCANLATDPVVYYPTTWTPGDTITNLPVALNDNWICTFENTYAEVTAVNLYDFKATAQQNDILLEWTTVSEYNNLGFNLFRATSAAGANYVQLNTELIPPIEPGGMQGGEYSYVDSYNLDPTATYYYWLQDVDLNGTLTLHEPVSTKPPEILADPGLPKFRIFLPSIVGGN